MGQQLFLRRVMAVKFHHGRKILDLSCGHSVRDTKGKTEAGKLFGCRVCGYRRHRKKS